MWRLRPPGPRPGAMCSPPSALPAGDRVMRRIPDVRLAWRFGSVRVAALLALLSAVQLELLPLVQPLVPDRPRLKSGSTATRPKACRRSVCQGLQIQRSGSAPDRSGGTRHRHVEIGAASLRGQVSRARFFFCAGPEDGTIVTIVERGTGSVRVLKTAATGQAVAALIAGLGAATGIS